MSIGEAETSVLNGSSTYTSISNVLGSQPELVGLESPLKVIELRRYYPNIEILKIPTETADGGVLYKDSDAPAVKFASFDYTGRIERKYAVGETLALSGYTFFLAELLTIPYAISHQMNAGDSQHVIEVWFDEKDHAIGYFWIALDGHITNQ